MYALLLYDHLILSEQEGADLCSKVRKSRGVRGITTDEKEKNIIKTPRKYLGVLLVAELDLNQRHHGYEPCALATELFRHNLNKMFRIFVSYGAYRARTYDPLLVRQMLSQLS